MSMSAQLEVVKGLFAKAQEKAEKVGGMFGLLPVLIALVAAK